MTNKSGKSSYLRSRNQIILAFLLGNWHKLTEFPKNNCVKVNIHKFIMVWNNWDIWVVWVLLNTFLWSLKSSAWNNHKSSMISSVLECVFFSPFLENQNCIEVESSSDLTGLWPQLKYIWSVAVHLSVFFLPLFSLSCGPDGTLSALWATATEAWLYCNVRVCSRHTGRQEALGEMDGWMGDMRRPDWTGRQRHHGCPSGFQAGRGVATPSLPGGWPSPALHTPVLHNTQMAAWYVTGGRRWRWTADALKYILCYTLQL